MSMKIYKKGQGKYTRLGTGFALALFSVIGCYKLYVILGESINNKEARLFISTLVPAGLFVVFCGLILWLMNKSSVADFMISAEGEMKKVSWSSRKEIIASTYVVIIFVVILAIILGTADYVFSSFFRKLFGVG